MTNAAKILEALHAVQAELAEIKARLGASPAAPPAADDPYVDADAVIAKYSVSRGTLHRWVHDEGCPHEMRGKILRFKLSEVEAWFCGRRSLRRVK